MKLEDIGFYTLSDERAMNVSLKTPLSRCELILTDACNFKCPYCRGLRQDCKGTMPFETASKVIKYWTDEHLTNVRFSGGEPTLYKRLSDLVRQARKEGIQRVAISTNGSSSWDKYQELIDAGVNDFSISLDGCCAAVGDAMAGGVSGAWDKVIQNITKISAQTYCSVGMVFTEDNIHDCLQSVRFADSLGVSDIRVIPSAQYNRALSELASLGEAFLNKYPILNYRIKNIKADRHVRGISSDNTNHCWLALDDMAIAGNWHFPCIIHLREGGNPVGKIGPNMRAERLHWLKNHQPCKDSICKNNCLDVCVDYNKKASLHK